MTIDRLPPQNIEAEQSVLGSLLIDHDAIIKIAPFLLAEDFYREAHGEIYAAILDLHERREPADFVTVCDELERRGQLEAVGGAAYLTSLINSVPTAIHIEHYAHIVERTTILRRLIEAAGKIAGLAYGEAEDVDAVVDRAEQILFDVSQRRVSRGLMPIKRILTEYYDRIEYLHRHKGQMVGLPTGFIDIDRLLGGMQRSDLIIVAGRPGMGKSSLGLSVAHNAALKNNAVVAFFSLEMSATQLVQRLIASETGINSQRLRIGDIRDIEWDKLVKASGTLAETSLFIDDTPSPSPMEIRTKCRRLAAEYGLDLVIVDYLQLMRGGARAENRVQEVSYISRQLKGLARELSVPVLAISQLSRAVESRQDKHPILSDLRESGTIEQDADVVMFIYRDEMYNQDTDKKNVAEIIVAKHRNGPTGLAHLGFKSEQTKFVNLERYQQDIGYSAELEAA
ncbi:MAG: replicative DNA helicase [Anaerolineae bacterium SM23_84]|nr:MAG: replicative DNA helicase [Anaerolineae bacterium SM23_84]